MKLLLAPGLIILLSFVSPLARAEDKIYQCRAEVGGQVGSFLHEGDSNFAVAHFFAGGRAGFYLNNNLSWEASILSGQVSTYQNPSNRDAHVIVPTLELQHHFGDGKLRPFVSTGVGAVSSQGPPRATSTYVAIPVGGGLKWLLTDNLMARVDGRWIANTHGSDDSHQGSYTGGLSWLFDRPSYYEPISSRKTRKNS